MKEIMYLLGVTSIKPTKNNYEKKQLKASKFREAVDTVSMRKRGANHNLLPDKETHLVATSEKKAMPSQPWMVNRLKL